MIVQPITSVELVEVGDQHFVDWLTNGRAARRFGPYPSAAVAQAKADKLIAYLQPSPPPQTPATLPIADDRRHEFIADMSRFSEGVLTQEWIRRKWRLDETVWDKLGADDALVEEIENAKIRRIRDGSHKREKAQLHVVKAPDILSGIMTDPAQSARHRVDAIKVLDGLAANGPGDARATEPVFIIKFDLTAGGGDVETITKTLGPTKSSDEPWPDAGTAPQELLPVIAANKVEDGGSGQPV